MDAETKGRVSALVDAYNRGEVAHGEVVATLRNLGVESVWKQDDIRSEGVRSCWACVRKCSSPLRCKRCNRACYCNASCQKYDWKTHKAECEALELAAGHMDVLLTPAETMLIYNRSEVPVATVAHMCGDDLATHMLPACREAIGEADFKAWVDACTGLEGSERRKRFIAARAQECADRGGSTGMRWLSDPIDAQAVAFLTQSTTAMRDSLARYPAVRTELIRQVDMLVASIRAFEARGGAALGKVRLSGHPAWVPGVLKVIQKRLEGVDVVLSHTNQQDSLQYAQSPILWSTRQTFCDLVRSRE